MTDRTDSDTFDVWIVGVFFSAVRFHTKSLPGRLWGLARVLWIVFFLSKGHYRPSDVAFRPAKENRLARAAVNVIISSPMLERPLFDLLMQLIDTFVSARIEMESHPTKMSNSPWRDGAGAESKQLTRPKMPNMIQLFFFISSLKWW